MSDARIKIPGYKIPGYKIEREIGRGGMAAVYLALQESLNRHVALKVMNPALSADEDFKTRFLNEGHIVGQLNHSHIVTVFDIGTYDSHYYLSMEYLPGGSLRDRIRNKLGVADALQIACSLGKALHYAHQRNFVHRDIKPLNVLFREDESPVLTDFGIAKALGSSSQLTRTGFAFGSVGYMSPEQALGKPIDHRSDIYSFGAMFWEMLTGQKLYESSDAFSLALKHATAPIPQLPEELQHLQPLLERLLAKQVEDRFASMDIFVGELEHYLKGSGKIFVDHRPHAVSPAPQPDADTLLKPPQSQPTASPEPAAQRAERIIPVSTVEPPPRSASSTTRVVGVGLLTLALLLGVTAWLVFVPPVSPPAADSAPIATDSSPIELTPDTPDPEPVVTAEQSIAELLAAGERHWQAGRYFEPAGENAFETYRLVSEQSPGNVEARDRLVALGRIRVAERLLSEAESLIERGDMAAGLTRINSGLVHFPEHIGLLELQQRVTTQLDQP